LTPLLPGESLIRIVTRHTTVPAPRSQTGTQAIERAFALLRSFTDARREWSLAALSRTHALTKPTTLRLLGVLEREGMVQRTEAGASYRLGPSAIEFGALAQRATDLPAAARPELAQLARVTGETASLEVLVGTQIMVLDEVRGRLRGSASEFVGARWPAHAAATGKVLLAAAREEGSLVWVRFLAGAARRLPRLTDRTVTSLSRLERELAAVTRAGYATAVEELDLGYAALGAPVRDHTGRVVAAICLGGPAARLSAARLPALARRVTSAALKVSRQLGSGAPLRGQGTTAHSRQQRNVS
jgi:DNA-binding IclR family transcriptional regulator